MTKLLLCYWVLDRTRCVVTDCLLGPIANAQSIPSSDPPVFATGPAPKVIGTVQPLALSALVSTIKAELMADHPRVGNDVMPPSRVVLHFTFLSSRNYENVSAPTPRVYFCNLQYTAQLRCGLA